MMVATLLQSVAGVPSPSTKRYSTGSNSGSLALAVNVMLVLGAAGLLDELKVVILGAALVPVTAPPVEKLNE